VIRVAVIGLGYWGPNLFRNLLSFPEKFSISYSKHPVHPATYASLHGLAEAHKIPLLTVTEIDWEGQKLPADDVFGDADVKLESKVSSDTETTPKVGGLAT